MTAQMLFELALSLMSELKANRESYTEFVVPCVNILMHELLPIERALKGDETISVTNIKALGDTVPFDARLIASCMSYGLARLLILGDDEYSKSGFFDKEYQDAKVNLMLTAPAKFVEIVNAYS